MNLLNENEYPKQIFTRKMNQLAVKPVQKNNVRLALKQIQQTDCVAIYLF